MATTSPSNIFYPVGTGFWNYTTDMAAMAGSVQAALDKQANSFSGTDSERIAFTVDAPNGALWSNTDGDMKVYQKRSDKWWPDYEFVPLSLTSDSGTPANSNFIADGPVGAHVSNFGRMVTMSGRMVQNTIFDWAAQSQWQLGWIPAPYRPSYNTFAAGLVYSPVTQYRLTNVVMGVQSSGLLRVNPYDRVANTNSSSGGNLNIPPITWFINV